MSQKRLLIVVNDARFFLSHRLPIALKAKAVGFDVHVATSGGVDVGEIEAHGLIHHQLFLTRRGVSPITESRTLFSFYILLLKLRPDIAHLVTIKPILYGLLISKLFRKLSVVAAISGLGPAFKVEAGRQSLTRHLVSIFYRIAFKKRKLRVIFQNENDRSVLTEITGIDRSKTCLIPGSGVDLSKYVNVPEPKISDHSAPVVLMAGRLLEDKGPRQFIEAAHQVKADGTDVRFLLAGGPDDSKGAITPEELESWKEEGVIEVLGFRSDMPNLIGNSHIFVLPSTYQEGLPKALVEAAACGRPVITTDHPGCRDAILPGETGLLCRPGDSQDLAELIRQLLNDRQLRIKLGSRGRLLAEEKFGIDSIVDAHLNLYQEVLRASNSD